MTKQTETHSLPRGAWVRPELRRLPAVGAEGNAGFAAVDNGAFS